jgi:hypothetical protein
VGTHRGGPRYRDRTPSLKDIGQIAFELAVASQIDPNNVDVLHNLSVLFRYTGDKNRAQLARDLAEEVQARH